MTRGLALIAAAFLVLTLLLPTAGQAQVAPPERPMGLAGAVASASSIGLNWSDNSANETGFRIERSANGTDFSMVGTTSANTASYTDQTVIKPNAYWYRVIAVNDAGESLPSNTVRVGWVGPIDPISVFQGNQNSGFPAYYSDDNGTRVALLPITGDGATAPTQTYEEPNSANPYSVQLGFEFEAFYYLVETSMATRRPDGTAGTAFVEFAVEAAFGTADPPEAAAPGEEMVFSRTRIRIDVPAAGTYTVQHPYGTNVFNVTTPGIRAINLTEDIGALARDFTTAATAVAPISGFLRQANPPAGWLGDGVTEGSVTGSPTGFNRVRITGPQGANLDGQGNNFVETDQFTVSARLFVGAPPEAGFNAACQPANCKTPAAVTFTDTSAGAPTSWLWDFGDGVTSNAQNPTHTYNAAGNYTVTLTAANLGGSDSRSQVASIFSDPVASFTKSAASGPAPLRVDFTDTSTGNLESWSWDFGDGNTSTKQNDNNRFRDPGTYTVTLTVANPVGSNSISQTVTVSTAFVASFTKTLDPVNGVAAVTVTFTDTSTGATPTGWSWDFGDGTTGTDQNPAPKTYSTPGNYTVTLTATSDLGPSSASQTVSVYGSPVASFTKSAGSGTAPLTVSFSDTSTGNVTGREWTLGNGTSSTAASPGTTYTAAGTYTITLTVTNPAGADSTSQTVSVSSPPPAGGNQGGGAQPQQQPQPTPVPVPTPTPTPTPTPVPPTPTPTPLPPVVAVAKNDGEATAVIRPGVRVKVELELEDRTLVTVGPGAFPTTVQLKVRRVEEKDLPKLPAKGKVRKAVEIEVFDDKALKVGSTAVQEPIVIEIPLSAEDLAAIGDDPNNVELHRYEEGLGVWVKLGSELDLARKVVRANLRHLSLFAVVVPVPVTQAQPTPTAAPPSAGGEVPGTSAWLLALVVGLGILLFGFRVLRGARQPIKKD
ncbi:MAG: PKD domain-containing protein [Chloroflexi bacterium]|nr:PKD domain-containing protein [Chloroflexota bacterium]